MEKHPRRKPKNYDGTELTTRKMTDLLPQVLARVSEVYKDRPDLVLGAWAEVVGPQLSKMTQAVSFNDGVLVVKVKNSSLLTLLSQYEKNRLLQNLRQKFPKIAIYNMQFKIG